MLDEKALSEAETKAKCITPAVVKNNHTLSDWECYTAWLGGEDDKLEELMERYGSPLTLYINGYLHDIHEAEDLMIEAFAYLLTKRPKIRENGFKAYLYKSARNMALRRKHTRKICFLIDDIEQEADGVVLLDEVLQLRERDRILHECIERLNPDYREVLYLTYFENMSYAEAAAVMGKTVKQITNLVYRGKQSLKELLKKEGITNANE